MIFEHTLSDDFFNVLAIELGDNLLQFLCIDFNTDRRQDLLDVGLVGGSFATQDSQKVSGDVTHSAKNHKTWINRLCPNMLLTLILVNEKSISLKVIITAHQSKDGDN